MNTVKYKNYTEFEQEKSKCCACEIGKTYNKVVLSCGNKINPKVVFCGEAPGKDEIDKANALVMFHIGQGKDFSDALGTGDVQNASALLAQVEKDPHKRVRAVEMLSAAQKALADNDKKKAGSQR